MPDFTMETMETGTKYLETSCIGSCSKRYRIDEHHPNFANVKTSLERGDRSHLFCYHKPLKF